MPADVPTGLRPSDEGLRLAVEALGLVVRNDTLRPDGVPNWTAALPGLARGDGFGPGEAARVLRERLDEAAQVAGAIKADRDRLLVALEHTHADLSKAERLKAEWQAACQREVDLCGEWIDLHRKASDGEAEANERAARFSSALTWIERNVPDGVALVARALSEVARG